MKGYQKRSRNHAVNYQFWPKSRKAGQILGDNKTARRIDDETARRNFLKRKSRNNWTFGEIIFLLSKFFRYCRFVLQTVEIFLTMAKYFQQWDFAKLYNFYPLKSTIPTRIIVHVCKLVYWIISRVYANLCTSITTTTSSSYEVHKVHPGHPLFSGMYVYYGVYVY